MLTRNRTASLAVLALALSAYAVPFAMQDGPTVSTEALDGTRAELALAGLAIQKMGTNPARIDFAIGAPRAVPGAKVLGTFELLLQSGDHVLGSVAGGSEENLSLDLACGARAEFAIDEIGSLFALSHKQNQGELAAPVTGDRLWRITPGGFDPLDGFLLGFDKTGVTVEGELGERLTPWSEVACLWIEALEERVKEDRTKDSEGRSPVAVDLSDGSRLRGHFGGIADGRLLLERQRHGTLSLPITAVAHIALEDARQSFLSDRVWREVGDSSLFGDDFGLRWPTRVDRAVTGGSLRAGGRSWARGLGVHAPSHLFFESLSGGSLRGGVAVDDSVLGIPAKGSVVFHILLDGEVVWSSSALTAGDPVVELPALEIASAKSLELKVDMASDSFMGDRANWLEIRIVKP